jgi:hypothetical protein
LGDESSSVPLISLSSKLSGNRIWTGSDTVGEDDGCIASQSVVYGICMLIGGLREVRNGVVEWNERMKYLKIFQEKKLKKNLFD